MENVIVLEMIHELTKIFVHIVIPGLAGITFFALAKFVKHIAPLRALVSSLQTYKAAYWSFLLFGCYLALRPVQALAGPHPWPMVISNIREFILIAIVGPAMFTAMMTLCFGPEKFNKWKVWPVFVFGAVLAVVYCLTNSKAIGGSEEIAKLGMLTAYDGLWYRNVRENLAQLMRILFIIRLLDPGLLLLVAAGVVMYHAKNYPEAKKKQYDNMPTKLYLMGAAVLVFSLSLIGGSFFYGLKKVPDQWGTYHLVALLAGILETISLSMPVRSEVQVSEHEG